MKEQHLLKPAIFFTLIVFLLMSFGLVMVFSSSYLYAREFHAQSSYFLFRQLLFVCLGSAVIYASRYFSFEQLQKYQFPLLNALTFFMLLTLIPELSFKIKGARRWLSIGPFGLQPGEFIKYLIILPSYHFFNEISLHKEKKWGRSLFYKSISLITPLVIFLLQPDFGAFTICLIMMSLMALLSDLPKKIFLYSCGFAALAFSGLLVSRPYRIRRILTFLDPWKDPQNTGFQIIQSYLAFAAGGPLGRGVGNSNEKLLYLPEAYNDFIFSVIGEEFGLLGVSVTMLLYLALLTVGLKMALVQDKKEKAIFITGLTMALVLQALLNMAVVLGLLPTKGLNLPFISYGGSSLVSNCMAVALILMTLNLTIPWKNILLGKKWQKEQ